MSTVKVGKKEVKKEVKKEEVTISHPKAMTDLATLKKKGIPEQKGTKGDEKKKFKEATKSVAKGRDKYGFLEGSKAQAVFTKLLEGADIKSLDKLCTSPAALRHIIAEFKKPIGSYSHARSAVIEIKDGKLKIIKFEFPKEKEINKKEEKK